MSDFPVFPNVFPVPIREGVTVRIQGIPHDLTPDEAAKIARVIVAIAQPKDTTHD